MKSRMTLLLLGVLVCVVGYVSMSSTQKLARYDVVNNEISAVKEYYVSELKALENSVEELKVLSKNASQDRVKEAFVKARSQYKHIEFIVDYFFRETALKLNGPNLLEAKASMPKLPLYPSGFQVVEEFVYTTGGMDRTSLLDEINGLNEGVHKLQQHKSEVVLDKANLMYALKLNVYRLITKGITGFDSPVSLNSIEECGFTLASMEKVLVKIDGAQGILGEVKSALVVLSNYDGSFDAFDRTNFIKNHLNKITEEIQLYTQQNNIAYPSHLDFAIRKDAKSMFEENAFDLSFFSPQDALELNDENIALGKMLFEEKLLSVDQSRSCATCHDPGKAFSDGQRFNTVINSEKELLRNTPSLVNAVYQTMQFYDGRSTFLEDQAHAVITNKEEMGGEFSKIISSLLKRKEYKKAFKAVYGKKKITDREIKLALAAFTRSLSAMNSPFDKFMRGEEEAISKEAQNGFNLFMGKAKCATCHFAPLFNGVAPPFYEKMESEVLGLPVENVEENAILDADLGKYEIYKIEHHKRAFKTTTVRNVELTSPYMHNGVFSTLEEVVDFYNEGGGKKYGFELENQTLPFDQLNLTEGEKENLVLFMKALTDKSFAE